MKKIKQSMKKCLSIFLSALILLTYAPTQAFAQVKAKKVKPQVVGHISAKELGKVVEKSVITFTVIPYRVIEQANGEIIKYYPDGTHEIVKSIPENVKKITLSESQMSKFNSKNPEVFFDIRYYVRTDYGDLVKKGDVITDAGDVIRNLKGSAFERGGAFCMRESYMNQCPSQHIQFIYDDYCDALASGKAAKTEQLLKSFVKGDTLKQLINTEYKIKQELLFLSQTPYAPTVATEYIDNVTAKLNKRTSEIISELIIADGGDGYYARLKSHIENYQQLLRDSIKEYSYYADLLAQEGSSPLEILANRYMKSGGEIAQEYFNIEQKIAYWEEIKQSLNSSMNIKELDGIRHNLFEEMAEFDHNLTDFSRQMKSSSKSVYQFASKKGKKKYLMAIFDELKKKMPKEDFDRLLQGIGIRMEDSLEAMVLKSQTALGNFSAEIAAKATKPNTLPRAIFEFIQLDKEGRAKFAAKIEGELADEHKYLIEAVLEQGDDFTNKLLGRYAKESAGEVLGKGLSKVGNNSLIIVTAVLVAVMIVNMDAVAANNFEQAINPLDFEYDEASNLQKLRFLKNPISAADIAENDQMLLELGQYLLSLGEAAGNPNTAKVLNDPMLEIKGWNPAEQSVNNRVNNRLAKDIK